MKVAAFVVAIVSVLANFSSEVFADESDASQIGHLIRRLDGSVLPHDACGDYVMLHSTDSTFGLHSRFCERPGLDRPALCAVAVECGGGGGGGGETVQILSVGHDLITYVNKRQLVLGKLASFSTASMKIQRQQGSVAVTCDSGFAVTVYRGIVRDDHSYLHLTASVPPAFAQLPEGRLDGLMALQHHPASASWLSDAHHHSTDTDAWRVTVGESLFSIGRRESGAECSPGHVRGRAALQGPRGQSRIKKDPQTEALKAKGREACAAMGLSGVALEMCAFDYLATGGDESLIRNAAEAAILMTGKVRQGAPGSTKHIRTVMLP